MVGLRKAVVGMMERYGRCEEGLCWDEGGRTLEGLC